MDGRIRQMGHLIGTGNHNLVEYFLRKWRFLIRLGMLFPLMVSIHPAGVKIARIVTDPPL